MQSITEQRRGRASARTRQLASRVANLSRDPDCHPRFLDAARVEHQVSRAIDELAELHAVIDRLELPLSSPMMRELRNAIAEIPTARGSHERTHS